MVSGSDQFADSSHIAVVGTAALAAVVAAAVAGRVSQAVPRTAAPATLGTTGMPRFHRGSLKVPTGASAVFCLAGLGPNPLEDEHVNGNQNG